MAFQSLLLGEGKAIRPPPKDLTASRFAATRNTSSLRNMVTHPAYRQIIRLGRNALPLLLRELNERPDHWSWLCMR